MEPRGFSEGTKGGRQSPQNLGKARPEAREAEDRRERQMVQKDIKLRDGG